MFKVGDYIDSVSLSAIRDELRRCSIQLIEEFEEVCPVEHGHDVFVVDVLAARGQYYAGHYHYLPQKR